MVANVLVFVGLLAAGFSAGEVYFRVFSDSPDAFSISRVGRRWTERHFQYNSANMRDNIEYSARIASGKRRVTFIGDSFTVGHGISDVDRRFGNLVRKDGDGWEVHVMARGGFDTGQELAFLRSLASEGYEFDVVVLVYVLNDVLDISPEWVEIVDRIYRSVQSEGPLLRHSFLANTLYYRTRLARDPDIRKYCRFVEAGYEGEAWTSQQRRLSAVAEFCRSQNATFGVVTFPFFGQDGERDRENGTGRTGQGERDRENGTGRIRSQKCA